MKTIQDKSIDAIIADPPYGTIACKWDSVIDFDLMWEQLNRIIKPNGAIVLFGSEPFSSALRMSNIKNYKYDWIWDKVKPYGVFNAKLKPLKRCENILVFSLGFTANGSKKNMPYYPQMKDAKKENIRPINKGSNNTDFINGKRNKKVINKSDKNYNPNKRYPDGVIKISSYQKETNSLNRIHPTQKPVELMEYLIKTYTNENETVLDFTMGSGSTGVAAKNLNRNFIGIEQDENYFNIATDRIKAVEYKLF
jgi:site-specific DNA-methyltransferase (adenine-specific)